MLEPIYELIFEMRSADHRLALKKDEVVISYKTYKSNDLIEMETITDQKLAPGNPL